MIFAWTLKNKSGAPQVVGPVLDVSIPSLGISSVEAKVDTGAFSGALHAVEIKEIKTAEGTKLLQFKPYGSTHELVTVETYHKRYVKSSNGQTARRYAFETEVVILGRRYPMIITLSNRSSMKYQMLVGRKFLRTNGFLVDVSMNKK